MSTRTFSIHANGCCGACKSVQRQSDKAQEIKDDGNDFVHHYRRSYPAKYDRLGMVEGGFVTDKRVGKYFARLKAQIRHVLNSIQV